MVVKLNKSHPDYPEYQEKIDRMVEKNLKERDEVSKTGDRVAYALLVKKQAKEFNALIKEYDRCYIYIDGEEKEG